MTVRQSDVAMALQAVRAVVYGTADDKATQKQMEVLGKSFSLIKYAHFAPPPPPGVDSRRILTD